MWLEIQIQERRLVKVLKRLLLKHLHPGQLLRTAQKDRHQEMRQQLLRMCLLKK